MMAAPLFTVLKPNGPGSYEVRGTSTGILVGWVKRYGDTWRGDVAVFGVDGNHELDQGQIVRRPAGGEHYETRHEAWAVVESQALRDALRPVEA